MLLLLLAILGAAGAYLIPLMRPAEVATYASYTVQRGSIATDKSFSASMDVLYSETHQNTSRAESIREIYVKNGQTVEKGDKLMLLDNGTLLKASLDGTITSMNYDTTDVLRNNAQLIQICDLTNLQVSLSIDEYDVRNIAPGQKCVVTVIPLGMDFEAEITHVDRVPASSGQVAYYTATAKLAVPSYVLPGMTASVTMPDEAAENVLLLDMAALAFDEQKQPYVLLQDGDTYTQLPVTTGLSDGVRVEITSGLSEGDTVWAVSGMETVETGFSLGELYKKIVGEKIVIRNVDAGNSRSRPFGNGTEGGLPGGFPWDGAAEQRGVDSSAAESFRLPQADGGNAGVRPDPGSIATGTDFPQQPPQERKMPQ